MTLWQNILGRCGRRPSRFTATRRPTFIALGRQEAGDGGRSDPHTSSERPPSGGPSSVRWCGDARRSARQVGVGRWRRVLPLVRHGASSQAWPVGRYALKRARRSAGVERCPRDSARAGGFQDASGAGGLCQLDREPDRPVPETAAPMRLATLADLERAGYDVHLRPAGRTRAVGHDCHGRPTVDDYYARRASRVGAAVAGQRAFAMPRAAARSSSSSTALRRSRADMTPGGPGDPAASGCRPSRFPRVEFSRYGPDSSTTSRTEARAVGALARRGGARRPWLCARPRPGCTTASCTIRSIRASATSTRRSAARRPTRAASDRSAACPVALIGVLYFAFVLVLIALCQRSAAARQNLAGYVFAVCDARPCRRAVSGLRVVLRAQDGLPALRRHLRRDHRVVPDLRCGGQVSHEQLFPVARRAICARLLRTPAALTARAWRLSLRRSSPSMLFPG